MVSHVVEELKESRRSVLGRAFDILECFADDESDQTIGSLCQKTDLPPATVHRMLANLADWGAIERTSRGRYRLGARLWRLGWGVPTARRLKDIARPFLVDLHSATGAASVIASRDGDHLVLADVVAGNAAARRLRLPRQLPLVGSVPGDVFLAHLSRDEAAQLLAAANEDADDFVRWQRLGEIRRAGVLAVRASRDLRTTWISAPIFDDLRQIRSTLSVVAPTEQVNVVAWSRAVGDTARAISRGLSVAMSAAS